MKRLEPQEIQEGKVFHQNGQSVEVLRLETRQIGAETFQVVVFREIGSHNGERNLRVPDFCDKYQRRKKKI